MLAPPASSLLTPGTPSMTGPQPSQLSHVISGKHETSDGSLKSHNSKVASVHCESNSLHAAVSLQPGSEQPFESTSDAGWPCRRTHGTFAKQVQKRAAGET